LAAFAIPMRMQRTFRDAKIVTANSAGDISHPGVCVINCYGGAD
jgi:hypothetical protein